MPQGTMQSPSPPDLAARVYQSVAVADPAKSLRRDSLAFFRTLAMSVGIQGPTGGVIVSAAIAAQFVGFGGALPQVLALAAMGFVAYAFVVFSRSFNTASSVYGFNGAALGPSYGLVSAWLLLVVYVSFAAGVYANTAGITQAFLASFGVSVWWVWLALAGFALTMLLAYLSIGSSSIVILVCEGLSILLISVVGVIVLAMGGYHHHAFSARPFELHNATFGVVALATVAAFGGFSGFEGAATLGEESRRSTRVIPAAIVASLVASALVYIAFTWLVDNSYPSTSVAALAADPAPLAHVASVYVSPTMAKVVTAAAAISAFGAQLACINAANRLLFALGRELGGGKQATNFLVRTDKRFRSPVGALVVSGTASLAGLMAFSFETDAVRALTLIVTLGSYLILAAYLMTLIAAGVWVWRHGRHKVVPEALLTVGIAVFAGIIYYTFQPFPSPPFNVIVYTAIGCLLAGVGIAVAPGVRRRLRHSELLGAAQGPVAGRGPSLPPTR